MRFYNATPERDLPSVIEHGLSGDMCKVRPGYLHLTHCCPTAESYHEHWGVGDTLIFRIDLDSLDESLLGPDRENLMDILDQNDDDRLWSECTWRESLEMSGNCTYRGTIPYDALVLERRIAATS